MTKADNQPKIIFIAPYKELAVVAESAIKQADISLNIRVGNLPYCLDIVREEMKNGVDVVITRGGNALKIRKEFNIPVVEIQVTVFDIIKALNQAKRFGNKIGIVGFSNVIYGASSLSSIIDSEIVEIKINSIEECPTAVQEAINLGVDTIVGDRIAVETASSFGLKGELIATNSYEGIINAYYEAVRIAEVRKKELAKAEEMRIITEFTHSGILAIDRNGMITLYNAEAEKVLENSRENVLGKHIDEIIPEFKLIEIYNRKQKELNEFVQFDNSCVVVHKIPILIENEAMGVVATFHKLEQIRRIEEKARKEFSQKGYVAKSTFDDIIGKSNIIKDTIKKASNFALVDSSVLITGETGVGKEVFAQGIHNYSFRKNGPFIAVNCAALPYNLLESELFGYVKGAFTGANTEGKAGLFEQAHGGTIFLDEIGEISLPVQARLLRVLQEGQVQRIGDNKIISVDVRIISATNKNLLELVQKNRFRDDLYYRINVLNLSLPSLRDRSEDIPLLAKYFIEKICEKYKKTIIGIENGVLQDLSQHSWPGNIRQLANICERLVVDCKTDYISKQNLNGVLDHNNDRGGEVLNLELITSRAIQKALEVSDNNKSKAAKLLGIDRTTLWRKIQDLGLQIVE